MARRFTVKKPDSLPLINAQRDMGYIQEPKRLLGELPALFSRLSLLNKALLAAATVAFLFLLWDRPLAAPPAAAQAPAAMLEAAGKAPAQNAGEFGRLKTTKCDLGSVAKGRPAIQYALMVDAGSTGSRIHIYRFNFCDGPSPSLEDEIFVQTTPGLSSYAGDAAAAAKSLDTLLERAKTAVPKKLWGCTPLAVKATAGLRLLSGTQGADILAAVRARLTAEFPFRVVAGDDGVVIMDGRDEGVYAWITVNYLLGNLGRQQRQPTAAILDLGGGSTQIVFEPEGAKVAEGDHRYELHFGQHTYVLYQHSYLGYGLMEGRRKLKSVHLTPQVLETAEIEQVPHPCLPVGYTEASKSSALVGASKSFDDCYAYLKSTDALFAQNAACETQPCSFDGVYMPSLAKSFRAPLDIFAFSYFYDRTNALALAKLPAPPAADAEPRYEEHAITVAHLRSLAKEYCPKDAKSAVVSDNPHLCLDLVFMYGLVARGYGLDDARGLRVAKKIRGFETGWCLGAAMVMVEAELTGHAGLGTQPECVLVKDA